MPFCRVCRGNDLEQFLDLGDQPHCNSLLFSDNAGTPEPRYPLRVCFCHNCTTVQIDYTVPKEQMFSDYLYVSGTTKTLRDHFRESSQRLVARLGLSAGDVVVDIGSNDGTWLKNYDRWQLRTVGVEPAHNLAKQAQGDGVETINAFFNVDIARDILVRYGYPKLITAAGVFFHLEELHSATEGIRLLLEGGGTFCVQAIYLGEIIRRNEFDNIYHEHLTYWTVRSISQLFAQFGLEIYNASLLPIHGGSLELLIGVTGTHQVDPSVHRFFAEEQALQLDDIRTYRAFAAEVWKICDRLLEILVGFKEAQKVVAAFGAPAKGSTLLNSFGIAKDLVQFAVETNQLKIGKFIPGARIPIVDEQTAPSSDAFLILPWNFLAEFLRNKRHYILNGGAFVVPIPTPLVIDAGNYHQYAS